MASSELNTFVKGMIKDIDPHYQDKTSYRDSKNARIISHRGKTFTIENIQGNSITSLPIPNTSDVLEIKFSDDMFAFGDVFYFTGLDIEYQLNNSGSWVNSGIQGKTFNANFATAGDTSTVDNDKYTYTTLEQFHKDLAIWIRANYTASAVPIKAASDGSSLIVWYPHTTSNIYALRWNNSTSDAIAFTEDISGGTDVSVHSMISSSTLVDHSGGINPDLFINSYYEFTDFIIVLTQKDQLGNTDGQIWKLEFNDDGDTSLWTLLYNKDLNFNKERKIIVEGVLENNCIEKIYWTDFSEDLRSANIQNDDLMGISPNLMSVFPHLKLSKPILSKIEESGQLLAGVYQYAYRLISEDGAISPISHFSQLIPITEASESNAVNNGGSPSYEGASAGTLCGKGVSMKITNIDTRYTKIEVIAIRHEVESLGTATGVDIIEQDSVTDDVYEFTHTDYTRSTPFTFDELLQNKNSWSVCKDIAIKDNRLFAGNLKNTRLSLDFDEKAKSYDIAGATYATDVNIDHFRYRYLDSDAFVRDPGVDGGGASGEDPDGAKLVFGGQSSGWVDSTKGGIRYTFHVDNYALDTKPHANKNSVTYSHYPPCEKWSKAGANSEKSPYEHLDTQEYKHRLNGFYRGPMSPYYNDVYRGYQRGEIYRFGIVFYDKRGNPDFARWVADVKIPDGHEAHMTNYAGHYINDYGYKSTQKTVLSTTIVNDTAGHRYYEYDGSGDTDAIGNYTNGITTAGAGTTAGGGDHVMISVSSIAGFPDKGFLWIRKNESSKDEIVYYSARVSNSNGKYFIVDDTENKGRGRYGVGPYNLEDVNQSVEQYLAYDDSTAQDWTIANTGKNGFAISYCDNTLGNSEKGNSTIYGQAIFPKFEVRLTEADRQKISGYSIVRVERQASDKTIVLQGVLSQVFKYAKNKDEGGDHNAELNGSMGMHPFPVWNKTELGPQIKHSYDSGTYAKTDIVIPGTYMLDSPDHHFGHTDLNTNDTLNIDIKANLSPKLDVGSGGADNSLLTDLHAISGSSSLQSSFAGYTDGDFEVAPIMLDQAAGNDDGQITCTNYASYASVRMCSTKDRTKHAFDKWCKYYTNREVSNSAYVQSATASTGRDKNNLSPTGKGNIYSTNSLASGSDFTTNATGSYTYSTVSDNPSVSTYTVDFADLHYQQIQEIVSVAPDGEVQSNSNFTYKFCNWTGGGRNTESPAYSTDAMGGNGSYTQDMFNVQLAGTSDANHLDGNIEDGFIFGDNGLFGRSAGCPTLLLKVTNRIFYSSDIDGRDPRKDQGFSNLLADNNGQYFYSALSSGGDDNNDNKDYKCGIEPWNAWQLDKKLCNIVRSVNTDTGTASKPKGQLVNQYGGTSASDRANNRYISTTHFQPIYDNEEIYRSVVGGGDVFVDMYMFAKHNQYREDWELGADSYSNCGGPNMQLSTEEDMYTCGIGFPVETSVNVQLRQGNYLDGEGYVRGSQGEEFIYNTAYSQQNNLKGFTVKPIDFCESQEHFPSTVAYSDVKLMGDNTQDAWLRWDFDAFHDLDQKYGDLTNLFIVRNDMYAIQESGVSRLAVNPRAILPSGDGVSVNVTSSGGAVIERHDYFSEIYGSRHQHSLVIGENAGYWFDVDKRKMLKLGWTEEGQFGIYKLSDKKGMRNYFRDLFEGQNIEDMPLLGRGIHGVYDRSTDDVILTINNSGYTVAVAGDYVDSKKIRTGNRVKKTVVYNEAVNAYTSFYTFYPRSYLRYRNNFYSSAKWGNDVYNEYLYKHNDPDVTGPVFYGDHNEFSFQAVINDSPLDVKTFDNLILNAETEDDTLFDTVVFSTNTQTSQTVNGTDDHYRVREGRHIIPVRSSSATERIRDTYLFAEFSHTGTLSGGSKKFNIFALYSKFRKSYR